MQYRKQGLEGYLHAIQQRVMELTDAHNTLQQTFDLAAEKASKLYKEKYWLEQSIPATKIVIRNNIKIKSIAEQIVYGFLAEHGVLLTSAIMSVLQALRVNRDRYAIVLDNSEYDNDNNEYIEGLREIASSFIKILLNQMIDKTMVAAAVKEAVK